MILKVLSKAGIKYYDVGRDFEIFACDIKSHHEEKDGGMSNTMIAHVLDEEHIPQEIVGPYSDGRGILAVWWNINGKQSVAFTGNAYLMDNKGNTVEVFKPRQTTAFADN